MDYLKEFLYEVDSYRSNLIKREHARIIAENARHEKAIQDHKKQIQYLTDINNEEILNLLAADYR